jgi:hypothetical protein
MTIPNTSKREMAPTHPGEMLREDFMPDYGLTTAALADALKAPLRPRRPQNIGISTAKPEGKLGTTRYGLDIDKRLIEIIY